MTFLVVGSAKAKRGTGPVVAPVAADPPTANDDSASVQTGGFTIRISPLDNDNDPLGEGLTIQSAVNSGGGSVAIVNGAQDLDYTSGPTDEVDIITYVAEAADGQTSQAIITVNVSEASGGSGGNSLATYNLGSDVEGAVPGSTVYFPDNTMDELYDGTQDEFWIYPRSGARFQVRRNGSVHRSWRYNEYKINQGDVLETRYRVPPYYGTVNHVYFRLEKNRLYGVKVTSLNMAVAEEGDYTRYSNVPENSAVFDPDREGDDPIVLNDISSQTSAGPAVLIPSEITASGTTLTLRPAVVMGSGTSFSYGWELRRGGTVLTSGNNHDIATFDASGEVGQTLSLVTTFSDSNGSPSPSTATIAV